MSICVGCGGRWEITLNDLHYYSWNVKAIDFAEDTITTYGYCRPCFQNSNGSVQTESASQDG